MIAWFAELLVCVSICILLFEWVDFVFHFKLCIDIPAILKIQNSFEKTTKRSALTDEEAKKGPYQAALFSLPYRICRLP